MTPLAVVIPARDEEAGLGATLAALAERPPLLLEVVVVDGGSRDRTAAVARAGGARVLSSPPGRAVQMNLGVAATGGDPILFLHADCRVEGTHLSALIEALKDPATSHGSFPIRIDDPSPAARLVERVANLRTRLDRTAYGDQALFVRRAAFTAAGGYPEVSILEDVLLSRRLRATGGFAFLAGPPVEVSPRRWNAQGWTATVLRSWATRALFELGVPPDRLHDLYAEGSLRQIFAIGGPGPRTGEWRRR